MDAAFCLVNIISPFAIACFGSNCSMDKEVMDLPEPDSPTITVISPEFIENEIPFTAAVTVSSVLKLTERLFIFKIGLSIIFKISEYIYNRR